MVALDRARAEIIVSYLASVGDMDGATLADEVGDALRAAAHIMVRAYVDVARDPGQLGSFHARVARLARDRAAASTWLGVGSAGNTAELDNRALAPGITVVTRWLSELLSGDLSTNALRKLLPSDMDFTRSCGLVDELALRLSEAASADMTSAAALDVRCAYGPCSAPAAGRLARSFPVRLERDRNHERAVSLAFDPPARRAPEPHETDDDLDIARRILARITRLDAVLEAQAAEGGTEPRDLQKLISRYCTLSFETFVETFRRVARDPLPTSGRDRDRQIYLAVIECFAVHGIGKLGIAVRGSGLLETIVWFVSDAHATAEELRRRLQGIADGLSRSDLEQRTTELLAGPVAAICNLPAKLDAELRANDIVDSDLRAWVATIVGWRQDFVEAGLYASPAVPRTSIYDQTKGSDHLAGWFRQWSRRPGRPTTVMYSAVIDLAGLS